MDFQIASNNKTFGMKFITQNPRIRPPKKSNSERVPKISRDNPRDNSSISPTDSGRSFLPEERRPATLFVFFHHERNPLTSKIIIFQPNSAQLYKLGLTQRDLQYIILCIFTRKHTLYLESSKAEQPSQLPYIKSFRIFQDIR